MTALDLGAGSGIIGALLAARGATVTGVEVREEWAALWPLTLASPALGGRLTLRRADLRDARGPVDVVVSNPPFFPRGTGPVAEQAWRAAARTESSATLADVVAVALAAAPAGLVVLVVPVERAPEVRRCAGEAGAGVAVDARVGARRAVVALRFGAADADPEVLTESDPRVVGWYARARGTAGG